MTHRKRQLYFSVEPREGESLRGLIARACHKNSLASSFAAMRYLGQAHRNRLRPSEDPVISGAHLATMLGCNEAKIETMRYPAVGLRQRLFHGTAIHQDRIETKRRRFSPAFLKHEQTHLALWELNDLPFCPVGWDLLLSCCPCQTDGGTIQRWSGTNSSIAHCDQCGERLDNLESPRVPESMRPILAMVAGFVDPDPQFRREALACLPSRIRNAAGGNLFSVVTRTSKFLDAAGKYVPSLHTEPTIKGLHAAGKILLDWPNGIECINSCSLQSSRSLQTLLTDYLALDERDKVQAPQLNSQISWVDHGSKHLATKPASHIAMLSIETLEDIWNDGLVTKYGRRHGNRIMPAFEETELRTVASRWHDRHDATEVASMFGIVKHGVEQMAALEVLPSDGIGLSGRGPYFTTSSLNRFDNELAARSTTFWKEETITLTGIMKMVGGRPKPWGPVLFTLMSGAISFEWKRNWKLCDAKVAIQDASELANLLFERTEHSSAIFDRYITQSAALDFINASIHRKNLLIGLSRTIENPRLLKVYEVEELAKKIVTTAEIATRLSMSCAAAYQFVTGAGLQPVNKGAFNRNSFECLIGAEMRQILLKLRRWDP